VINSLKERFDIRLFFYNPNIFPKTEYMRRLGAIQKVSREYGVPLVVPENNPNIFSQQIKGFENEPEGGRRCEICYQIRLEATAEYARKNNYDIFATTLTISPHKDIKTINALGNMLQEHYSVSYLESDFRKDDGFRKSVQLSKEMRLYRQKYCGCIYSLKSSIQSPNE
jgi:hypothetical protein